MKPVINILRRDPLLRPFTGSLLERVQGFEAAKSALLAPGETLADFANGHLYFGFHQLPGQWAFREWAPNAEAVFLMGDFNGWDPASHPLHPLPGGNWELLVPGELPHRSKVRLVVHAGGETLERIPAYIRRAVQNPETMEFDGQVWHPQTPYRWKHPCPAPGRAKPLLIYEGHIGMSGEAPGVAGYDDFRREVLPRVRDLGYNAVQLMAIQEHPYYASFGYQVANFFAASSRFGTPEELKHLIDEAHGMGIAVLLDVVHSHAAPNELEGLARFDGTGTQYFHAGSRGAHPQWGTKLFDYAKPAVRHFLLSNLKFWLEEYRFDGFRFDGVTSMLYLDHGLGDSFTNYRRYFGPNTDNDALTYLQLATALCREVRPGGAFIAEDMSGMPGLCLPIEEGGVGFGYRLAMGVPDYWTRTLEKPDEGWSVGKLWWELGQRRPGEKVIGYCESHDQALVGGKTIFFRLADAEIYRGMERASQNPFIERAMALHKMIRLITCLCAGEGYLNFMGNEFGHPDWIDFPRPGNGDDYRYARRQWSLADDPRLRYGQLQAFDGAMVHLARNTHILASPPTLLVEDEEGGVLVFEKGGYLCAFNFHPAKPYTARLPKKVAGALSRVLATEERAFGGPGAEKKTGQSYFPAAGACPSGPAAPPYGG